MFDTDETQNHAVVKSNRLVQKSKITLSLVEQRIINYMISTIKPTDTEFDYIRMDYKHFCEISGVKDTNFTRIKKIVKDLYDKSWEVFDGEYYVPIRWLGDYKISTHEVLLLFHRRMSDLLLNLIQYGNFTQTELWCYFQFKNKYTPIFYDYFRSYINLTVRNTPPVIERRLSVEELRGKLGLETPNNKGKLKYPLFKDLRVNVLDPCMQELNLYTDMLVTYDIMKSGRKTDIIIFHISPKPFHERLQARNITPPEMERDTDN